MRLICNDDSKWLQTKFKVRIENKRGSIENMIVTQ